MTLSEKLKALRENKGKTQREIAAVLGVSENTYKNWENGRRPENIGELFPLAIYYDVPKKFLMEETPKRDKDRIKETQKIRWTNFLISWKRRNGNDSKRKIKGAENGKRQNTRGSCHYFRCISKNILCMGKRAKASNISGAYTVGRLL